LVCLGLGFAPPGAFPWTNVTVDETGSYTGVRHDLAMDSSRLIHVVYPYQSGGNTYIKFAYSNGENPSSFDTSLDPVDTLSGSVASSVDIHIALDALDYPHVVYYDPSNHAVKHAWYNDNSGWIAEAVETGDSTNRVGEWCDIAMDGDKLYIAYTKKTDSGAKRQLNWAKITGITGWNSKTETDTNYTLATVDSSTSTDVGSYCSIAIKSGDSYPRFAYYDAVNGNLIYASRSGFLWNRENVLDNAVGGTDADDVGKYAHIALNASGVPYISYFNATDNKVYFTSRNSGNPTDPWTAPTAVTQSGRQATGPNDLYLFGPSGGTVNVGVVFVDEPSGGGNDSLKYWYQNSGVYEDTDSPVSSPPASIGWCALATGPYNYLGDQYSTDTVNRANILYYDGTDDRLKFTQDDSGVTAVDIMDFKAAAKGKRDVELSWQTGPEPGDLLGFNIYKWQKGPEKSQKVNASLIPAQGEDMGARYTYTDLRVKKRNRWNYLLEAVYTRGATTTLGPTRVQ